MKLNGLTAIPGDPISPFSPCAPCQTNVLLNRVSSLFVYEQMLRMMNQKRVLQGEYFH